MTIPEPEERNATTTRDRLLGRVTYRGHVVTTVRIGANWRTTIDDGTTVTHVGWSKTEAAAERLYRDTANAMIERLRPKCPYANLPKSKVYTLAPLREEQWAHLRGENCGHPDCDVAPAVSEES